MKLFDTHCHINDERFDDDLPEVIGRMKESGIERAVLIGDVSSDESKSLDIINSNDFIYGAFGLHPHDASKWSPEKAEKLVKLMSLPKVVALGEIGLDYHYDLSPRDEQKDVFEAQLALAYKLNKPVVLHIREAHGDAFDIMNARFHQGKLPAGIMHCYSGSVESAKAYIEMGLYVSFSGSLTFKNANKLLDVARALPSDRILIETDCPYMAPVPMRGQRNEPAFVRFTCDKLAELRGITPEEAAEMTYNNGMRFFDL